MKLLYVEGEGLIRFARFVEAKTVDVSAMRPAALKRYLKKVINEQLSAIGYVLINAVHNPNALEIITSNINMLTAARIAPQPQPVETPHAWRLVMPGSNLRI